MCLIPLGFRDESPSVKSPCRSRDAAQEFSILGHGSPSRLGPERGVKKSKRGVANHTD